ncbi:MAG: hypothetical protein ACPKOI_09115 [Pleomorphochaeta sp.]|jgi:hypothetical protein
MKKIKFSLMFILFCLFFISCDDKIFTSSLSLNLNQETTRKSKSILPEDIPLEVTQYTITGQGPNVEDTFTINTRDKKTTIEGITIGSWDLFAVGKNCDGLILVSGTNTVEVKQEPTSTVIELNKLVGNGNIDIDFIWNPELVNNPKLELELANQNNNKIKVSPTSIDYSQGYATFETVTKSDSYTLNAKLYDGDVLVSGCIEAIRVVMNKTSSGTIQFKLNSENDDNYNSDSNIPITINNQTGTPITCSIKQVPDIVEYNKEICPILQESNDIPLNNFNIDWYLDGTIIGSGIDCKFLASIGFHRLDVIVENGNIGSTSSAHKDFEVKINAPTFLPKVISTINNSENGYNVGLNMHICFLPDNKIISYCGETKTLQICRLINNKIEVINTYNSSSEMPLSNVIDMKVDAIRNRVFISEQNSNTINIYDYCYNKLTPYFTDDSYHQYAKHFGQIFIRPQDFLVFDNLGDSYREYNIDPKEDNSFFAINMVKNPDDISYHCSNGLMSPDLDAVTFASDTGFVSHAYNTPGYDNCLLRATAALKYNSGEVLSAGALDWKSFIIGANDRIILGSLTGDNLLYSTTIEEKISYSSQQENLPQFSDVCNFIYYNEYDEINNKSDISKIYALCGGSKSLLAFNVNMVDLSLDYIGKEDFIDFTPKNGILSKDKSILILWGNNEKCIKICQINH